jgi:hypothetical protein
LNLINTIRKITVTQPAKPSPTDFSFTLNLKSAHKNYLILTKKYHGNLQLALDANRDLPLGMGSEF